VIFRRDRDHLVISSSGSCLVAALRSVAARRPGLPKEQLAWAAGLHQTEIARIEGGRRNPGLDTIFKVARGLGVPPAELFPVIA